MFGTHNFFYDSSGCWFCLIASLSHRVDTWTSCTPLLPKDWICGGCPQVSLQLSQLSSSYIQSSASSSPHFLSVLLQALSVQCRGQTSQLWHHLVLLSLLEWLPFLSFLLHFVGGWYSNLLSRLSCFLLVFPLNQEVFSSNFASVLFSRVSFAS
jgi:hypothetical protein